MPDLLYVVTHGLISLVQKKDGAFDALMIEMDDHRFLAGTWLDERPIEPGEYELKGVGNDRTSVPPEMLGEPVLDPARNIVLPVKTVPGLGPGVRTIIHLPCPVAVHSYYPAKIDGLLEGDAEVVQGASKELSGVQVFVYSVLAGAKPELVGHPWSPTPGRLKPPFPGVSVLHLFNEPSAAFTEQRPFTAQLQHNLDEFGKGADVLGVNLRLTQQAVASPSDAQRVIPGILRLELQPLAFRGKVVTAVVEALFSKDGDPIGTDPATCNAPHGRGL